MQVNLIEQLETVLSNRNISQRADILRKVTDLFVVGSGKLTELQIDLFDDVMCRLQEGVDQAVRAQFGDRLARLPDAPRRVTNQLALEEAIEVAGPVLRYSERVDTSTLLTVARSKGQTHLLAISCRKSIPYDVTDVLIERGDPNVLRSTAQNEGASLSSSGLSNLIAKARTDDKLAKPIWVRCDVPRQDLVRLFTEVSESLRLQLEEADPRRAKEIRVAVSTATERIQSEARESSKSAPKALSLVQKLRDLGHLNESQVLRFAQEGDFDKVTASMSLMCDLPMNAVERTFVHEQSEQIIILAKSLDFAWSTTMQLLLLHAGPNGSSRQHLDRCFAS